MYERAAAAFEQGRLPEAEQALRSSLREHPKDSHALGILGAVLDSEKQYAEAEKCYQMALVLEPHSIAVLSNLGNHYLIQGKSKPARAAYQRVVAFDAHHENANLHLAEMAIEAREGSSALHYLDQLQAEARTQPAAEFLRVRALRLVGDGTAAENLLDRIVEGAKGDPRIAFSAGMIYVDWQLYGKAEQALSRASELAPGNFDIFYNLGLASIKAGHLERAGEALEAALREKRDDVDCLLALSRVYVERERPEEAMRLLGEARRLAPGRAEILLSVARLTEKSGAYADTAAAYEEYLRLRPNDDWARRERGFALARSGKFTEALADLKRYVDEHPKDPIGFYELAVAETVRDGAKSEQHLNRALALDPDSLAARYARAALTYRNGKPLDAEADLQFILKRDPRNYRALDTMGEVDAELNRPVQAEAYLRQAADLAPRDPQVLVHYARILQESNREQEAARVLNSLKGLGLPAARAAPPHEDLQGVLGLAAALPAVQRATDLQTKLVKDPNNLDLNLKLAGTLLARGNTADALNVYRTIQGLASDAKVYAQCGKALLDSEQYGLAREFLRAALAHDSSNSDARLDLVVTLFHTAGPAEALSELDGMLPVSGKYEGDYYLLRAQVLDSIGRTQEAVDSLNRGFRASPTRTDLYFESVLFLIKHQLYQQALDLIQQARHVVSDSPQLLVAEAVVYEVLQRSDQAEQILARIQTQWPEWSLSYLLRGVILISHFKFAEAKYQLQIALALGGDDATAYYYLALAHTQTSPPDIAAAEKAVRRALAMNATNARAQALAGKIALSQKRYDMALNYMNSAVRLDADLEDAHEQLSSLYRAVGEKEKSIAELKQVLAIKQKKAGSSQSPAAISNLLFAVGRPPAGYSAAVP